MNVILGIDLSDTGALYKDTLSFDNNLMCDKRHAVPYTTRETDVLVPSTLSHVQYLIETVGFSCFLPPIRYTTYTVTLS